MDFGDQINSSSRQPLTYSNWKKQIVPSICTKVKAARRDGSVPPIKAFHVYADPSHDMSNVEYGQIVSKGRFRAADGRTRQDTSASDAKNYYKFSFQAGFDVVKVSVIRQNALYFGFVSLQGLPRGQFLSQYISLVAGKYASDFQQSPPNLAIQISVFLEPNLSSMRMKQHESLLYSLRGWMPQQNSLYHQQER